MLKAMWHKEIMCVAYKEIITDIEDEYYILPMF